MRKSIRKDLRPRQNQREKKYFKPVGSTNKLYRNRIPRTLQIATRRNKSQVLKFVKNMTFELNPQTTVSAENAFLKIRANSIHDILPASLNQAGTWTASDPDYQSDGRVVNADGWDEWCGGGTALARYKHFTVLGSKISVNFRPHKTPSGAGNDSESVGHLYTVLTAEPASSTVINPTTRSYQIDKLPYHSKAIVLPSSDFASSGARLYKFYSARKFEGVRNVQDNDKLQGSTEDPTPSGPFEQSTYFVGMVNLKPGIGSGDSEDPPRGVLQIRVEYITLLQEPTNSNKVQMNNVIESTMV